MNQHWCIALHLRVNHNPICRRTAQLKAALHASSKGTKPQQAYSNPTNTRPLSHAKLLQAYDESNPIPTGIDNGKRLNRPKNVLRSYCSPKFPRDMGQPEQSAGVPKERETKKRNDPIPGRRDTTTTTRKKAQWTDTSSRHTQHRQKASGCIPHFPRDHNPHPFLFVAPKSVTLRATTMETMTRLSFHFFLSLASVTKLMKHAQLA